MCRASLRRLEDVLAYGHRYYSSLNKKHIEALLRFFNVQKQLKCLLPTLGLVGHSL